MSVTYRDACIDDAPAIRAVYVESFDAVFRHLYSAEDYDSFMSGHGDAAFRDQIGDEAYAFRLAEADGRLVGYCKLGPPSLPYDPEGKRCIELRQLYLLEAAKGGGVAQALMDWSFVEARRRGAEEMWLSVFSENLRAQRLYDRYGFEKMGEFDFMVGKHADHEFLYRLRLHD